MADSDLYMQCDEDDLEPCQHDADTDYTEEKRLDANGGAQNNQDHSKCSAVPPESATITPSANAPDTDSINSPTMPLITGPQVTKTILPQVLQPVQVTPGGLLGPSTASGQPIFITSQTVPVQNAITSQGLGYVLNGQQIAIVPAAQAAQFLAPQLMTQLGQQPVISAGNLNPLQLPVTFAFRGSSGIPTIGTATSAGLAQMTVSPSSVGPITTTTTSPPGSAALVTVTKQPRQHIIPNEVINTVQNTSVNPVVGTRVTAGVNPVADTAVSPAINSSKGMENDPAKSQASVATTARVNKVFKGVTSQPKLCNRCGSHFKMVFALRGYMCLCNLELTKLVASLNPKPKYRMRQHKEPSRPKAPTPKPSRQIVKSPTLRTIEIPEGVPSPGTGDLDNHGKLIMMVEDFYYGKTEGRLSLQTERNQIPVMIKCHLCDKKLKNNIKLMNHMRHHMEMEQQRGEVETHTMCQHCYRRFPTPFSLQCHVESVHSQVETSANCKICEWSYENEPAFLQHMKNNHKPGEMPYVCQVCDFHSSFYNDVIVHFREVHKDTIHLQCPYCLKVFKTSNSYQLHYSRHQKRSVYHCDKCRLQFLYTKDKADHKLQHHKTHVRPKQLVGLKPGTRVTIRAYAIRKVIDDHDLATSQNVQASRIIEVPSNPLLQVQNVPQPPPPPLHLSPPQNPMRKITPTKRKPAESMVELLTKFQHKWELEPSVKQICLECKFEIPNFFNHFPTLVGCSLCHYKTCCSRAYANHMINNHVARKNATRYLALFKPCPKSNKLRCAVCDYTTQVGDLMAKHLVESPDHYASVCLPNDGFSRGYKRFVFIPTDLIRETPNLSKRGLMSFQVMQVGQGTHPSTTPFLQPNQSITLPAIPAHAPSIPVPAQPVDRSALPEENGNELSNREESSRGEGAEGSLSVVQLKTVLYALCFGVPQAADHFDTPPEQVQAWLLERQRRRPGRIRGDRTELLVEWVLAQREQQLPIDEGTLFSKATHFMRHEEQHYISYAWAVDFMLSHDLGVQVAAQTGRLLPRNAQENVRSFSRFIRKHASAQNFGASAIGAMDELSIFVDVEQLNEDTADASSMMSAFKLSGTEAPLVDVVLAVLADGTVLPTMLFLRGEPPCPDAPLLPDSVVLEARPQGFTDEERLQLWLAKVWRRHVEPSSGGKGLLLLDTYRGHMENDFLAALNSANTLPSVIPRSCSCRLQPLEACVGPVLREFLQARWSQRVAGAPEGLAGARPADLAVLLAGWLAEILDVLVAQPELLRRSFNMVLCTSVGNTDSPAELVRSLTEALIVSKLQEGELEMPAAEERATPSDMASVNSWPSPAANPQALKRIFEKDSDLESFHGFEDTEMVEY